MILKRYRLQFTTPLHISSGGYGLESADTFIHSDTLFSAVAVMAVDLLGEAVAKEHFLNADSPSIALSSAFPWRQDVFFFPKPLSLQPEWDRKEEEEVDFMKGWRNVKFLSENYLRPALASGKIFLKKEYFQKHLAKDCLSHKLLDDFYENIELPRVVLDRVTNAATIFHFAQVTFEENSGLFFLAKFKNEKAQQAFETALRALGDDGIGGERSSGKGLFEVKDILDFDMPQVESQEGCLNLSLFIPGGEELNGFDFKKSSYRLLNRRGWVSRHTVRRKTRRVFTEGSVLHFREKPFEPQGELERMFKKGEFNLHHDVYRSWQAFTLPVHILPDEHKKLMEHDK